MTIHAPQEQLSWPQRHQGWAIALILVAGLFGNPVLGVVVAGVVALRSRGDLRVFAIVMAFAFAVVFVFLTLQPWHPGVTSVTTGGSY